MKSLLAFLLLRTAWASPWCATGIKMPDFREDGGQPSVEVMMAQSPLFSTNPNIGTKLQWLNLYHTALVFVQKVPGQEVKNWTVEFDSVTNVLGAIKPQIEGDQVIWDHDARFCATEGVLWGEAHWSKIFEVVLRLNADQARRIFTEFIPAVNETSPATKPLYQLMRAESTTNGETLVKDITCGDGTNWILNFCKDKLGVAPYPGFEFKSTNIVFRADHLEPVDANSPEVVAYFTELSDFLGPRTTEETAVPRYLEFLYFSQVHYVYDSNIKTYYKVEGNRFPWVEIQYRALPLESPRVLEQQPHGPFLL
ncbi:unnamed protein product [Effrenium voratum]|nr:unnamed protein product [Effrenium voratum]